MPRPNAGGRTTRRGSAGLRTVDREVDLGARREVRGEDRVVATLNTRSRGRDAPVDVVGGDTLFNVIKSLKYGGSVAACGLVQSPMFQASVLPFILRGVNLLGVDSVELPLATKVRVWNRLGSEWHLDNLDAMVKEIGFEELPTSLAQVLKGQAQGRFLLNLNG